MLTLRSNLSLIDAINRMLIAALIIMIVALNNLTEIVYPLKIFMILWLIITNRVIKLNTYAIWMMCFLAVGVLSAIWAINLGTTVFFLEWELQALFIALAIGTTIRTNEDIYFIFKCFAFAGFLLVMRVYATMPLSTIMSYRLGARLGYNANELALKLASSVWMSVYLLSLKKSKWMKYFLFLNIVLVLSVILLTGSKSGFLVTISVIAIFYVLKSKNRKIIPRVILSALILFFVYQLVMHVDIIYNLIGKRIEGLIKIFDDSSTADASTLERMSMYKNGWKMFTEKPLLGYGLGNFSAYMGYKKDHYSHSNFIELLSGLGAIGFIFYYFIYAYIIVKLLKIRKNTAQSNLTNFAIACIITITIFEIGLVSFQNDYIQINVMIAYFVYYINRQDIKSLKDTVIKYEIGKDKEHKA